MGRKRAPEQGRWWTGIPGERSREEGTREVLMG